MKRILFVLTLVMTAFSTTFCSKQGQNGVNPLLAEFDTPYGVPPFDLIKTEHYAPAFEQAMSLHNAEIEAIISNNEEPTFANTVAEYDRSGRLLSDLSNIFGMMSAAMNNPEMQELQEKLMPRLAAHYDAISMNEELFKRIKVVYDKRNSTNLDEYQIRLTEKLYNAAVRQGALLNKEQKERLTEINEELSVLSVKFDNNILAENNDFKLELTAAEVNDLPQSVRNAAMERGKQEGKENCFIFTLHKPSMLPFLTYSSRRNLREQIYKAYLNRCSNDNENDNKKIINDIVRLRIEKAKLLGYKSWADYIISEQMAKSPKAAYALLEDIWTPAVERAKEELAKMNEMFRNDVSGSDVKFESWDWWYYAEKVRKREYSLNDEQIRPYFSLDNVRQGAFNLANRLYGLTFRPVILPLYHNEVSAYEVLDNDGSHLGVLYFDFHPRESKSQGAWCGYFRTPSYNREGKRIAPVVSIVCNFTRPSGSVPALLDLDETLTLFHEFGHALHFLFSDVPYNGLLDVEGDFVELPSQIMENWALEPELLRTYAVHYNSHNIISDTFIERIKRSAQFNQGFATTELIAAALCDLDIHSLQEFKEIDVESFEYEALYEKRKMISEIEPRYHLPYFAHIFAGGYSSGYYFYTWAEVLDKDAYAAFVETGDIFNRRKAQALRTLLASGGKRDGMDLYREFRGGEPSREPLLKARGLWVEPEQTESEEVVEESAAPIEQPKPQVTDHRTRKLKVQKIVEDDSTNDF